MPIFEIEAPGGAVLSIEAADEAQALAGARQWHADRASSTTGTPPADKPAVIGAQPWDLGSSILDGMAFGTLPNAQAGVIAGAKAAGDALGVSNSGKTFSENYDAEVGAAQDARRQYRDAHPIANTAGNVAGGVATGMGLAKGGVTIVGNMASRGAANIIPRMAAGGVEGATYGAASGFGGAEGGFENRAQAALDNMPLGAVVGAGAVPVVDVVSAAARGARNMYVGQTDPNRRADELLVQAIMRDKQTPDQLARALDAAKAAGQGEYALVDAAGRNAQRVGAMAAKTPGEFRDTAAKAVAARQAGQGGRIGTYVDEAVGDGQGAFATEQALLQNRRAAVQPLYEAAYTAPAPRGQLYDDLLTKQSVQDAMGSAQRVAAERQVPISDLFTDVPNPNPQVRQVPTGVLDPSGAPVMRAEAVNPTMRVPTVRGWDFIKRELDAKVNQLYSAGDTTAAEAVKETRNALRAQLGADVPEYGAALAQYADDSAALEAIQAGRDLVRAGNTDEGAAAFQALSPGQQDLARVGFSREVGNKLGAMRTPQDKTQVFDTPNMAAKLDTVVPDPVARAVFEGRMGRERDMVRANRQLFGGSNTTENLADAADSAAGSALAAAATGRYATALGRMFAPAIRAGHGMTEETAQRVGERLLNTDPAAASALAEMFATAQQRAAQPTLAPVGVMAGFNSPRHGRERARAGGR